MKWILKAYIQKSVAVLPRFVADPLYYALQRKAGGLRRLDPFPRFEAGVRMAHLMAKHGGDIAGKRMLEIGTGWRLNTPLALWLMGADVLTVDLNRFLKPELVLSDLKALASAKDKVKALCDFQPLREDRWEALVAAAEKGVTAKNLTEILPGLQYAAPQDASKLTGEKDGAFYGSFSYTVLEHIPPQVLKSIFGEAARVTDPRGFSVHMVDHSDHFSHADKSLSSANFLRYSEAEWKRFGANRFAYCNRLRTTYFADLFQSCGFSLLDIEPNLDQEALADIKSGHLPLAPEFAAVRPEELAVRDTWFVMQKRTGA